LKLRGIEWIDNTSFKLYFKEGVFSKWYGLKIDQSNINQYNQFEFPADKIISKVIIFFDDSRDLRAIEFRDNQGNCIISTNKGQKYIEK
jgi:hypothetical protein